MLDLPDNLMKLNASDRLAVYGYAHEYAKIKSKESYLKGYAEAAVSNEYKAAAPLCDKHQPNGGKRSVCLICALQAQSAALSQISYLCGPPNEMECSPYDVHCDESAVVEQVRSALKEKS